MNSETIFLNEMPLNTRSKEISGNFITIQDEVFYRIGNFDQMQPFFISLASDSNHWMYISSSGGVSAGRINPDNALFPYYTDDKIQESSEITGSKTIFQVIHNGKRKLWEPFSMRYAGIYNIKRNIYKSTSGNKLCFEEINLDLSLTFSYCWMNSEQFGWVKKSSLINLINQPIELVVLDGIQNILPYGIQRFTQNKFSTLLDGYKKSERVSGTDLGLYRLESIPVDKAEPSEALKVTTVWSTGISKPHILLSSMQLDKFRQGKPLADETGSKGIKGAFFISGKLILEPGQNHNWYIVAEINQDSVNVNNLVDLLNKNHNLAGQLEQDIEKGTNNLKAIVADADGVQQTADRNVVSRHFSNVLFNVMRGGIFNEGYLINTSDFVKHVSHFNHPLASQLSEFFKTLPDSIHYAQLEELIVEKNDADLQRLFLEYLPLTFSRRHGDPSRPWNEFSINIKDEAGARLLSYQGNWRDIFQNWEALSLSYPEYIHGMIAKFVNATTADGYNPYRVTRQGIDWETIEPDNPWSNIGYWGDHQIIYLLKLMEVSKNYFPDHLISWLNKELFAYANVPYRMKSYSGIYSDPKHSITFDDKLHKTIEKRVPEFGADAKLILDSDHKVLKVSFTEKLLSPLLAKLSNFIPGAGIWMNTLRPEWNDANNALVGYGTSMVTLYYMRRFLCFIEELYKNTPLKEFVVSDEIVQFTLNITRVLKANESVLSSGITNENRKQITDGLGEAGNQYRQQIYRGFSGSKGKITKPEINALIQLSLQFIDQSIDSNQRPDGLFNAYNLVNLSENSISIRYLQEMLEGQVAVLSSGKLSAVESVKILDSMRKSALYRPDQESYMLYPNKTLPKFLDKNNIPAEWVENSPFLSALVNNGNTQIISKDVRGVYHFNGAFTNAGDLKEALQKLPKGATLSMTEKDEKNVLELFERLFDHQSFTGRSGTFYKYEGLGSIYWHMVSKLLVAIGETIKNAGINGDSNEIIHQLSVHYQLVQKGIGAHKSPEAYGSFPFDPYSHTPIMSGVQQPGMTGQVKEDIISRFFELGVLVKNGHLEFNPVILNQEEFINPSASSVTPFSHPYLKFTYCTVPVIYIWDNQPGIELTYQHSENKLITEYRLGVEDSKAVFGRTGEIEQIIVHLNNQQVRNFRS